MADKSKQRVEQDYARNVIHDKETGHDKAAAYEKRKLIEVAAESHGYSASPDKVHRKSRENRGNNYNPWEEREALVEDNPVSDIEAGTAEGDYTS